jgi:hypothetical protein
MTQLDYLVVRRGTDPAAETAAMALRDLLHLPIAGVERGELWRFELAPDARLAPAREAIERAAARAGRYLNSNRDTGIWLEGPRPYPRAAPRGGTAVDLWVRNGDGRDAAALRYFERQPDAAVRGLRRGVLWRLWVQAPADRAEEIAWNAAETRSRSQGLLFNPHAQTGEILAVVAD